MNLNDSYGGEKIYNARKKYKPENFIYEILAELEFDTKLESKDVLNDLEIYYIKLYDSFKNGYNSTDGGGGASGYTTSEETKKLQSKIRTGKFIGDKHPNYGKPRTEEVKKILSIKCSGWKHTEEAKKKICEAGKGVVFSDERKKNIKKALEKLSSPILQMDDNDNALQTFRTLNIAFENTNIQPSNIAAVCNKRRNKAGGFKWKYINIEEYEYYKTIL